MRFLCAAALLALLGAASPSARGAGQVENGLAVLQPVPSFSFIDQEGHKFTKKNLLGKTWVADYIYTQCTSICPMLTAQMQMVQRDVQGHDVSFVSFSVDPAHDTPAALRDYAARWHDKGGRWRLLNTHDKATVQRFMEHMQAELVTSPDAEIMHSERFVLIDRRGRVRGTYDSTDPAQIKKLGADAAALADASRAPQRPAAAPALKGRELAVSMGCITCHTQPRIAPALEGVAGSQVMLESGQTVMADEAYLRESILDPDKKIVAGYPNNMPSYREHLSDSQIDSLVAYLVSVGQARAQDSSAKPRTTAVCPVCGMTVSAADDTPHTVHGGKTYYFCSEADLDTFKQDPARYAR